jgi:hypothetical protein
MFHESFELASEYKIMFYCVELIILVQGSELRTACGNYGYENSRSICCVVCKMSPTKSGIFSTYLRSIRRAAHNPNLHNFFSSVMNTRFRII